VIQASEKVDIQWVETPDLRRFSHLWINLPY